MRGAYLALAVNNPKTTLLMAAVKFFGRYKQSNAIRDGVLLGLPRMRRRWWRRASTSTTLNFATGPAQVGRQDRAPQPPFPRSLSGARIRPRIGPEFRRPPRRCLGAVDAPVDGERHQLVQLGELQAVHSVYPVYSPVGFRRICVAAGPVG
jgi:hypothetical protein